MMAYAVGRRTPELGLRMALGPARGNVLRLVLTEAVMLVSIGIGLALPLALALSHYLEGILFQLNPGNLLTLLMATAVLTLVAFIAVYIPALRATRIDPITALPWE